MAYLNRGLAYNQLGQYDKAIADCTKAIELEPDLADAYYNRAIAHRKNGDRVKADADHVSAKQLGYEPDDE
jgi:tetratricopeptide (TPR) repeat protein